MVLAEDQALSGRDDDGCYYARHVCLYSELDKLRGQNLGDFTPSMAFDGGLSVSASEELVNINPGNQPN